jgi:hypothetical protein
MIEPSERFGFANDRNSKDDIILNKNLMLARGSSERLRGNKFKNVKSTGSLRRRQEQTKLNELKGQPHANRIVAKAMGKTPRVIKTSFTLSGKPRLNKPISYGEEQLGGRKTYKKRRKNKGKKSIRRKRY